MDQEYIEAPIITPDITIEERRNSFKKNRHKKFYKKIETPMTEEYRRTSIAEFKRDMSKYKEESYILRIFYWIKKKCPFI